GVINIAAGKLIGGIDATEYKPRSIQFVTNRHVVMRISETRRSQRIKGKWEQSYAFSYDIETQKLQTMFNRFKDLYPAQGGLGRVVGVDPDGEHVYMPAYIGDLGAQEPVYSLTRVNLTNGRARVVKSGNSHTEDWFMNDRGEVIAREDFVSSGKHRLYSYLGKRPKRVFEQRVDYPSISLIGVHPDGKSLMYTAFEDNFEAVYQMSLEDGASSEPIVMRDDADIDQVITDLNRKFRGVRFSGPLPSYDYIDEAFEQAVTNVSGLYPTSSVWPVSATADRNRVVMIVSGNQGARRYVLYNREANTLATLSNGYGIAAEDMGGIRAIRYSARDGTKIPAIMTAPPGVDTPAQLPLLVFPHGGPESYDSLAFDWWAQYFARLGYLVLQPNFRGSTGYGIEFRDAGRGEWGKLMQDDVTDGVQVMINNGYADPERICIMGASYGGYSALAGGAFTPDLYRCVISVAGVSNLPRMLQDDKYYSGDHWVTSYWEDVIGDSREERNKLRSVSPFHAATNFTAPVLLVHGRDDTIVYINQSRMMARALKKAKAQVELVTLKEADHWLSQPSTRKATLRAMTEFLLKHNPPTRRQES
ncbi:MAG: S9 family peptidase, partial [Pseudomonadota bacterium]